MWFIVSIAGYFANAVSTLSSKYLLEKLVSHPAVYAFWVSIFGLVALIFVPFGFTLPTLPLILVSMAAGALFTFALLLLYFALQKSEASRISAIVGGVTPIFVLLAAQFALQENLSLSQIAAFFVILLGGYVISEKLGKSGLFLKNEVIAASIGSALLFALSNVLTKWIYLNSPFANGFVWRSIGGLAGCIVLLLIPVYRREILASFKHPKVKTEVLFVIGQIFSAIGFISINYATSLGSVSLVNALSGTQYVFLFFLLWPISKKYPHMLEEAITPKIVRQKIVSLVLIGAGIFLLFI
jgi:drug/metabolite transporter (DMT)-like permease